MRVIFPAGEENILISYKILIDLRACMIQHLVEVQLSLLPLLKFQV